ncbi:hemin transporter [Streptomyces sioyaensis]|uniref:nitric oxide dioxygenase n=1 Tax=Streptomyces sioyaensis TaxID=67364 RepID=A0A4Q1R734_9ACTN|nr:globin domain-containing protein [Streptomyces sioyaensis]MBM4791699.1 hemin transporter [Streptomyces sioyaensis]RXS69126.1 hemin transporter [Streptomyces sioyaensis]
MLSSESAKTVTATLPAVSGAIDEITALFYEKLFTAHPELLRDLFNRGNQANGSQRQALAGAIAAFAGHLVAHPDSRPDTMLARIAHKHASLGVREDQYPIVREHLFAAIAEVLGDAVTDEVVRAWDEVYWLMAHALIAIEKRIGAEAGVQDGRVWRPYRVAGRIQETDEVATFLLQPADGAPVPPSRPGQYVSVQVQLPDGARQIRQYSLSGQPDGGLQISVKRVAAGRRAGAPSEDPAGEVSGYLHAYVHGGEILYVSPPFGDVVLSEEDGEGPLLFASAGIGCTPMIGMLSHLAAAGSRRRIITAHADRSPATHPFRTDLRRLTDKLTHATAELWYEEGLQDGGELQDGEGVRCDRAEQVTAEAVTVRTGLMDLTQLSLPAGTTAYLCGPVPFMKAARTQLLAAGVPAAQIHYEVFGPDLGLS